MNVVKINAFRITLSFKAAMTIPSMMDSTAVKRPRRNKLVGCSWRFQNKKPMDTKDPTIVRIMNQTFD